MSNDSRRPQPLAGIKVLEFGSLIAGPFATSLLAQFGADVIKIEPPGTGDPLRKWRKLHGDTSLWWYSQSRNKKSITLNLKSPKAQQIVRDLVKGADLIVENFAPGTLEKFNLGWNDLSRVNPSLVMVRISGFGQSGPYRDRLGFGAIAEALGGLRYVTGYPDRPPVRVGVSIGDTLASLYGVFGALLAIHHVKVNHGKGQCIDVALHEAVFGVMESLIPEFSAMGHIRERTGGSLPGIAPTNTYPCRGGSYVVIAGNSDGIFRRFMNAIGRGDLAEDPTLANNADRARQSDMLDAAIEEWTKQHELEEVLRVLADANVPAAKIYSAEDIYHDPHFRARNMIERVHLPDGTAVDIPGIVPKLSETPGQTNWIGPGLGEHTPEVLASIGIGEDTLKELTDEGVV